MNDGEEVLGEIRTLLHSRLFGVLATQGQKYPYCSLVGYAASEDLKHIYFATIRDTRKFRNLQDSPQVSLLIDDLVNQVDDFVDAHALTVLGVAHEVDDFARATALSLYLKKLPFLKDFVMAPNCALIKVKVSKYISVNNFQSVMEYTMQ